MNKVILLGRLGKAPELHNTANGKTVCNFSIATSESWKDADGNRQERTEWNNVVVWGKQAEACGEYLAKGQQVAVEGSIRSRSYDDKNGVKRTAVEIVAERVEFLGSSNRQEAA